jgi:hypothetical protein
MIPQSPEHRAAPHFSAEKFADQVVTAFRESTIALTPIVGRRGVDALYQRSLHVASRTMTGWRRPVWTRKQRWTWPA